MRPVTTFKPGDLGYAEGWLIGGPLDGTGYRDVPVFPDDEPATRLVIPVDEAHRDYGIYQRRICRWPNGRWYYDFLATTTDPDTTPVMTGAVSGPTSVLPPASEAHPSDAASKLLWPESTHSEPAGLQPQRGNSAATPGSFTPARRFLLAQWWWIASELARRSSTLRLMTFPSMHDPIELRLRVRSTRDSRNVTFNTTGGVILYRNDTVQRLAHADLFTTNSPHDVVKHIELELGWAGPTSATTPRSLAYRLIAGVMGAKINDRHTWAVEEIRMEDQYEIHRRFHAFGTLLHTFETLDPHSLIFDDPDTPAIWELRRDDTPVAVFVEDGAMFQRGKKRLDLAAFYSNRHRNFDETLAHVLARVNQVPLDRKQNLP